MYWRFSSECLLLFALFSQPKAPVITRVCYLLECAHFVHQCNRGQWPTWLKMNTPTGYRASKGASGPMGHHHSGSIGPGHFQHQQTLQQRKTQALQLQASKLFHQWAEVSAEANTGNKKREQRLYPVLGYPSDFGREIYGGCWKQIMISGNSFVIRSSSNLSLSPSRSREREFACSRHNSSTDLGLNSSSYSSTRTDH